MYIVYSYTYPSNFWYTFEMKLYQKLDWYVYGYIIYIITSKKKRLNRSQRPKPHFVSFKQRTVTNYSEKEKTEPFPKTQASFYYVFMYIPV